MMSLPDFKEKQVVVCYASQGHKLSFKNDNLIIKDASENTIIQLTCYRIFSLWIVGSITLTSGILQRSKKFGFSIMLMSHNHKIYGLWNSVTEGNYLLRQKQYEYSSIEIPKHLISNKIENQTWLLKTNREKSLSLKVAIKKLESHKYESENTNDLFSLLGIEGSASRLFFGNWFADIPWKGRKPRAKIDIFNVTLDIGYTYLFNLMECMLNLYGFDLYKGTLHKFFYERKSLVCDLVEPFRCIVDKLVRRACGLKQLQKKDFIENKGQFFLKLEKNKEYTKWLMEGILDYRLELFSYVQSYYRCFIRSKPVSEYPTFQIQNKD